ncbi:MAG: MFS transporter [Oscillospiraceae bacterium]|nr:MFS transporter [Oscillospiraceae bacterium]
MGKLRDTIEKIKENDRQPENMKSKEYLGFALGRFCFESIKKMYEGYIHPYYLSLGVSSTKAGAAIMVQKAYDAVNDPVIAAVIDNRKDISKGRFKPFIAPFIPFLVVTSILMFLIPGFESASAILAWGFMTYVIWSTLNTIASVSFEAISTVLSADPDERNRYTTIGNIGFTLAGALPGLIPAAYGYFVDTRGWSQANYYTMCAVLFSVMGGVAGIFTKNLKERIFPEQKKESIKESFKLLFQNKELLILWSTDIPQVISSAAGPTSWQYYVHCIGNPLWQTIQWMICGIPQAVVQPLAPFFIKRYRPSRIIMATSILNGLSFLVLYPLTKHFGYNSWQGIVFLLIFASLGFIPSGIVGIAKRILQINTFDYVAAKTGKRAEATSLALTGTLSKLLWAFASFLGGIALDYVGFIPGDNIPQSDVTKAGLLFVFTMLPAIGSLLSIIPLFFFKLEGREFERRMAELAARGSVMAEIETELE